MYSSYCCCKLIKKILIDLPMNQLESTHIYSDNYDAISIANNCIFYNRVKHFKIKLYFLKEVYKKNKVILFYCRTNDQINMS